MALNPWSLLKQTGREWSEDNVPRLGAALAFYSALSIAPLLVLSLGIASFFFGDAAARGELEEQMRGLVGEHGAAAIQAMIADGQTLDSGTLVTVLGLATLLFGASGVFAELQDSMNLIWGVKPRPGNTLLRMLRERFFSFLMVLGSAFLLLVSLVVSAVLTAVGTTLEGLPGDSYRLSQLLDGAISFAAITLLFALMFKLLPDVKIAWRDVWLGAALTAVLFLAGKLAIGFYLGHSALASSYGVAGSFVVLLVWIYYAAQIVFFGAEFTQVYAKTRGSRRPGEAGKEK